MPCLVVVLALVSTAGVLGDASPARTVARVECTETVSGGTARAITHTVANTRPGGVVCVGPGTYDSGPVEIHRSGRPDAPVEVRALGQVVLSGIRIDADHVKIAGFEITSPPDRAGSDSPMAGILLRGTKLVVSDNFVHDTAGHGIACDPRGRACVHALFSRNTVRRADGSGIVVFGRDDRVIGNDIAESVRVRSNDADGVRFFGTGHVFRSNRVHDISAAGYPDNPPHTDCFQTFDNGKPATIDVSIDGNICDNVDSQCLIATAEQSAERGMIGRSHGLRFTNNICRNRGAQGILVEHFPDVVIAFNAFAETIQNRAAIFLGGSRRAVFLDNVVDGNYRAYEFDDSSRRGWRAERNLRALGRPGVPPTERGVESATLLFAAPLGAPIEERYAPAPGSPVIDAGIEVPGVEHDLVGKPRPHDGAGSNAARPDVGPFEYQ